jgi:CheY-like chemotaxis protein
VTPFYHPTSILVLDDDPLFLESIDFQFSDELSCQTFTRPDAALDHLRVQESEHPDFRRYFKDCSEMPLGEELRLGDRLLRLQLSELRAVMDEPARHQRISVAIVDFDMPKMTGVEFCRAIRELPVKTILLTGKAGLETAIGAFNEGLIDCFLQKQDISVSSALRREIKRLQEAYFEAVSDPIKSALALQKSHFLDDPHFVELFKDICESNNIIEHFVTASPPGIVMRDADGNESFLLVSDPELAKAHREVAETRNAPADMLELLRAGKAQAWFPTREGAYHPDYAADWNRYIWPAQALPGSGTWNYSVIRHEPSIIEGALQARSA